MSPFLIGERDYIYFKAPGRALRVGDIVFFQRTNGRFILYRICKVKGDDYYTIGDAQSEIEGPISEKQIFAVGAKVKRKGKTLEPGDFWWEFFAKVWSCVIPLRPQIKRLYGLICK